MYPSYFYSCVACAQGSGRPPPRPDAWQDVSNLPLTLTQLELGVLGIVLLDMVPGKLLTPLPLTLALLVLVALVVVLLDLVPGVMLAPLHLTLAQLVLGALCTILLDLACGELLAPLLLTLAQLVLRALALGFRSPRPCAWRALSVWDKYKIFGRMKIQIYSLP